MRKKFLKGPDSDKQYKDVIFYRKGGMGEIYSAYDTLNKNKVAIKIIPVDNRDEYNLLKTEFDISQSLTHKNILRTHYHDEFELSGTLYLYCAMQYCDNGNLREYLKSQNQLIELKTILDLMINLAEGMEYAHTKIIHRDLKPENCLFDDDRTLLICDFGLAKLIDSKTRTRTYKGYGTLPYMSPECWELDKNTELMDIYSLGIMFYELLTLQMPFTGTSELEFRNKHLFEPLPNITNIRTGLPNRLIDMICKMANKRYQDRYHSMSEIVQVLKEIRESDDKKEDTKIDALLNKANRKVSLTEQQTLAKQKYQETIETKQKLIDFSIGSLFDEINNKVTILNESLEREKIKIIRNNNQLKIRFLDKSFSILFYPYSDIQATLDRRKSTLLQSDVRRYGYDPSNLPTLNIQKDNVVIIGQMAFNSISHGSRVWGYNLLLRKNEPQDLYGKWWVVWFNDSGFRGNDSHYPIGIPEFYSEYEYGRDRTMHVRSMGMNTLESEGLDLIFDKLFE